MPTPIPAPKKSRSLRLVVSSATGALLVVFVSLVLFILYRTMPHMLEQAEAKYLAEQMRAVRWALDDATQNTYAMAEDIAIWDATVEYVKGNFPTFINDSWPDAPLLETYGFNFVCIQTMSGQRLYTDFYDRAAGQTAEAPPGFFARLDDIAAQVAEKYRAGVPLPDDAAIEDFGVGGIITYQGGHYLLAAMPVMSSRESAQPHGVVILGHLLDDAFFLNLTHMETIAFSWEAAPAGLAVGNATVIDDDEVSLLLPMETLDGGRLALRLRDARVVYNDGVKDITLAAVLLLVAIVLFGALVYAVMSLLVLRPMARLERDIEGISAGGTLQPRSYSKTREFTALCAAINRLVERLDKSDSAQQVLQSILNGIDACLYVSDPDTNEILFINDKMRQQFGYTEDLVGRVCWQALQKGQDGRCGFCPIPALLQNPGETVEWDEDNPVTGRHYHNMDTMIPWTGGRMVHLQHSTDTTDVRLAQQALTQRLAQQELMTEMASSFIAEEDRHTLIEKALAMVGDFLDIDLIMMTSYDFDGELLVFEHVWQSGRLENAPLLHDAQPLSKNDGVYKNFVESRNPFFICNNTGLLGDGHAIVRLGVRAFVSVPLTVNGEPWGVLSFDEMRGPRTWTSSEIHLAQMLSSVISAVVARDQADRALRRARDEAEAAREQAEQASRAKSSFLSRMSHEMRTPMNAIIGMTHIAKTAADPERVAYCLDKVDEASTHLLGVINDILDVSKIEAGRFELSYTEFDLEKMLLRVTNVMNFRIEERQQTFIVRLDKAVPRAVIADEQRLAQVLTNLLGNAVKFTPEGGTIRLEVTAADAGDGEKSLLFKVADTGIGLSEEQQARLFTPFEQADGGIARRYGGTGLGLAISKSVVELMGGHIWVESALGKGATFAFRVTVRQGKSAPAPGENMNWKDLRVLAVDDAPEVREYFLEVAESLGLNCTVAAGSGEALEKLDAQDENAPYNLVFVDWKMPEMSGVELTRRIRERCGGNAVVIMISAAEWSEIEDEAKAAGVNGFIPKPLFSSLIVNCINSYLGPPQAKTEAGGGTAGEAGIFRGRRLLLAEDIDVNREIVAALLEHTGIAIENAANGFEAVQLFRQHPGAYDLILMDIHMPEMDGFTATGKIRAMGTPRALSVPIVAMTANVFREDIERCLEAGMNDHIGKPVDAQELVEKLKKYLN